MNRREFMKYSACLGGAGAAVGDGSTLDAAASEPMPGRLYYASPSGGGNGQSATSPFQIEDFWAVARPGDTLQMLAGTYTGDASMIDPPPELHGTVEAPITVKAMDDGGVVIDGEGQHRPAALVRND